MKSLTERRYCTFYDGAKKIRLLNLPAISPETTLWKFPQNLGSYAKELQTYVYIYITNALYISVKDIAMLYKKRWQVELFFYDKHIIGAKSKQDYV